MRPYDFWLALLLGLSLLPADVLGALAFVCIVTVIGMPVAFFLFAVPGLATILIPARLLDRLVLQRIFPGSRKTGFAALGLVLALSSIYAVVDNAKQTAVISGLMAGDFDDLPRPIAEQAIALVSDGDKPSCDDFCQRLLLTGQATSVLVASNKDWLLTDGPDLSTIAYRFQLEPLQTCQLLSHAPDKTPLDLPSEVGAPKGLQAHALIGAYRDAGICLTERPSTLAAADLIILDGNVLRPEPKKQHSFGHGEDMVAAQRREVWLKKDGQKVMAARWTHVTAPRMPWIAFPALVDGAHFKFSRGFYRTKANIPEYQPGLGRFAQEVLGLRLSLKDVELPGRADGKDPLLEALKIPGTVPDHVQSLLIARLAAESAADPTASAPRSLLLTLLADTRIPVTREVHGAAKLLIAAAPLDYNAEVTAAAIARVAAIRAAAHDASAPEQTDKPQEFVGMDGSDLYFLAAILAEMPKAALAPHADAVLGMVSDNVTRLLFRPFVARLSEFGAPGAKVLFDVVRDTWQPKDGNENELFQHAYRGLCRMGPEARVILPDLLASVKSKEISVNIGQSRLIALLLALEYPVDKIEALFRAADPKLAEELLEGEVLSATKSCAL